MPVLVEMDMNDRAGDIASLQPWRAHRTGYLLIRRGGVVSSRSICARGRASARSHPGSQTVIEVSFNPRSSVDEPSF
ncbi:MAG: hypothetical protein ACMG6S_33355, partial [Byssovorax sp.]